MELQLPDEGIPYGDNWEDQNNASFLDDYALLQSLEERTRVPKIFLAFAALVLVVAFVLSIVGVTRIGNLVAFLYPAYCTFIVLERDTGIRPVSARGSPIKVERENHQTELVFWLTYWVVFAAFTLFENVFDLLFSWFQYYTAAKLGFLFWCFLPQTKGCSVVYDKCIRPFMAEHKESIERTIDKASEGIMRASGELTTATTGMISSALTSAVAPAAASTVAQLVAKFSAKPPDSPPPDLQQRRASKPENGTPSRMGEKPAGH